MKKIPILILVLSSFVQAGEFKNLPGSWSCKSTGTGSDVFDTLLDMHIDNEVNRYDRKGIMKSKAIINGKPAIEVSFSESGTVILLDESSVKFVPLNTNLDIDRGEIFFQKAGMSKKDLENRLVEDEVGTVIKTSLNYLEIYIEKNDVSYICESKKHTKKT